MIISTSHIFLLSFEKFTVLFVLTPFWLAKLRQILNFFPLKFRVPFVHFVVFASINQMDFRVVCPWRGKDSVHVSKYTRQRSTSGNSSVRYWNNNQPIGVCIVRADGIKCCLCGCELWLCALVFHEDELEWCNVRWSAVRIFKGFENDRKCLRQLVMGELYVLICIPDSIFDLPAYSSMARILEPETEFIDSGSEWGMHMHGRVAKRHRQGLAIRKVDFFGDWCRFGPLLSPQSAALSRRYCHIHSFQIHTFHLGEVRLS